MHLCTGYGNRHSSSGPFFAELLIEIPEIGFIRHSQSGILRIARDGRTAQSNPSRRLGSVSVKSPYTHRRAASKASLSEIFGLP